MQGSGNVVTEVREVRDFNEVHLTGSGTLTVEQGDEESLTIEAEDNVIPEIETEVRNHILTIGYRHNRFGPMHPMRPIKYNLTVRHLNCIRSSGSANMRMPSLRTDRLEIHISGSGNAELGNLIADELSTRISGSGQFDVVGEVPMQDVRISGSGDYRARDVQSKDVEVTVSGSGRAEVRASRQLAVRISGSGDVEYIGSPNVVRRITGSGRVTKISDDATSR